MRIELNPYLFLNPRISGLKLNSSSVSYPANFGNASVKDTFQHTSVDYYFNDDFIRNIVSSNDELAQILKNNNISGRLNIKELQELKDGHMLVTKDVCERIAQNLPMAMKANVNLKDLRAAALLHDYGKVLIPSEVLNKNGKLTPDEYKIMKLHSELGYQILKKSGLNENVLNLIRNHHNNLDSKNKFIYDVDLQVLNLADKYSALTEKRVYKRALSPTEALTILASEVKEGKIHPMVFNALVKAVNSNPFANGDMLKVRTNFA